MATMWNLQQGCDGNAANTIHAETCDASPELMQFGHFKIDVVARTASLNGHDLHLSTEEFDVLMFLTEHRQRLVTSHTVLKSRNTKGMHETEFLKTLLSLRTKLEAAGSGKHYLRAEPWVIYRFDPTAL